MEPEPIKLICAGMTFEETRHPEPFRMGRHSHNNAHLVLLFAGGIESYSYNRTSAVSRSDLLFVPPGETHTSRYKERVHAFYIHFHPAWWEQRIQQDLLNALQMGCEHRDTPPARMAARLHQEFQRHDDLTPLMLEALTLELLVTMARGESYARANDAVPRWLLQGRDFLHAHFTENLSIDDVATAAGVHPGHLTRVFRQHYRCSVGDYLRQLRVEQACRLLTSPNNGQSLSQIALSLGFADQSHFCRTVKRLTGKTPTELRNRAGRIAPETEAPLEQKMLL